MREWWNTPQAAYAFLTLGIGAGAMLTYVSPQIGIPIGGSLIIAGIILLINAYKNKSKKGPIRMNGWKRPGKQTLP